MLSFDRRCANLFCVGGNYQEIKIPTQVAGICIIFVEMNTS